MKTLTDHLSQYAAYHRDQRNIITHFIGIPLIVIAVAIVLSRLGLAVYGLWLSPALIVAMIAAVFYLRLDVRFGITMCVLLIGCLWIGMHCAQLSTGAWLAWGLGSFIVGWIIQFIGHYYEGRKPAFVDDIMGLAIGPLFVVAELAFICELRKSLENDIETRLDQRKAK